MKSLNMLLSLMVVVNIAGCSSVKFFEEKQNNEDVGFLYYPPKPYVLVEQGEKSISTKVISLPDLSRPHRVKYSEGFGSAELGFTIENGMIATFNSKSDTKTPEAIGAFTGIATAKAALITAEAAMATATKELQPSEDKSLVPPSALKYEVISVNGALDKIKNKVILVLSKAPTTGIFKREIAILNEQADKLSRMSTIQYAVEKPDELINRLEEIRKSSVSIINELKGVNAALIIYSENVEAYPKDFSYALDAKDKLSGVIKELAAFSSRSSSIVGLYEIEFVSGQLKLRKVTFE